MNNRKVINNSCYNAFPSFSLLAQRKEAKRKGVCGGGKKSFPSRRPAGGTTQSTMQANAEAKRAWTMLSCEEKKMRSILTYSIVLSPQPCYGGRIFSFTPHVSDMTLTTREIQRFQQWQNATMSTEVTPCNLLFSFLCFVSFFFSGRRKKERNEGKNFYYHTNHLGSTAFVTDQNQTVTQGFLYAPFGEITTEYAPSWQNGTLPKYSFNAKELDEETGMYYYEARYYKPPVFTSRDAMFEKYFWMTPYAYCANNPVKYVDPSGKEVSTHTDENGKVIKVYNDGNIGIYKHSKDEIKAFKNGQEFSNDVENLVGYTLHENSFKENDKIDFGSYVAKEWMKYFELWANNACIGQKDGIFKYGIMAVNGGIFDPKSRLKNGSQISDMVYFSPRDLGN